MPQKFTFPSDPLPRLMARDAQAFTGRILNYPQTLLSVIIRTLDNSTKLAGAKLFLSASAGETERYSSIHKNIANSLAFASMAGQKERNDLHALCNHCMLGKP